MFGFLKDRKKSVIAIFQVCGEAAKGGLRRCQRGVGMRHRVQGERPFHMVKT